MRPHLETPFRNERTHHFAVCRRLHAAVPLQALPLVQKAEPADADELGALWDLTFEPDSRSTLRSDLESGQEVAVIIRDAGNLVAAAAYVAATDQSAMILGVATHPAHRRKGYGSACVYQLTHLLQASGRSGCLFFDNPDAGAIYHRLGFEDIGLWAQIVFA